MSRKSPYWTVFGTLALGLARPALAGQDTPPMPPPAAQLPVIPSTERADAPAQQPADAPTVLLLTNGHVLRGEILEDPTGYYLRHRIGVKHFARRNVAGVFHTPEQAYEHLRARTPRDDPDELMKLALWCIEQRMTVQAREQLQAVLTLNQDNSRAKAMLFHLDASSGAADPAVERTAGHAQADSSDRAPADAPRELSGSAIEQLRQNPPNGPPDILGLPQALAVGRYQDFQRRVHYELQRHCARCHDAQTHAGSFLLYRARAARDMADEMVLRTNLDATLRLVNADDLPHSSLLSAAALTHPPNGRPVLGGPNHPAYRVLHAWVNSLRDPNAAASVTPSSAVATPTPGAIPQAGTETFAASRAEAAPAAPAQPDRLSGPVVTAPPRIVGGDQARFTAAPRDMPADTEFPDPSALPYAPDPPATLPALPSTGPTAPPTAPAVKPGTATGKSGKRLPPGVVELEDGTLALRLQDGTLVPYVSTEALRSAPKTDDAPDPAKQAIQAGARRSQIDSAALQKFMQQRAGSK
jgi:hypothetical protein